MFVLYLLLIIAVVGAVVFYIQYKNVSEKVNLLSNENNILKNQNEQLLQENKNLSSDLSSVKVLLNQLENNLNEIKIQKEIFEKNNHQLVSENSTYKERIKNLEEQLQEKSKLNNEIVENLKKEFEIISSNLNQKYTQLLSEKNKEILTNTISPVKEYLSQLKEVEQKIQRYYDNENKERSSLKTIIDNLIKQNNEVQQTAEKLATALTTKPKQQGNWGEMVLENLLELSGLEKNREYFIQQTQQSNKIPDVIVKLPNERVIIIDSKVTLNSLTNYFSATTQEEMDLQGKNICNSIRDHYKNLSEKNYEKEIGANTLDFVLMFVPLDSVMAIVNQYDANLFNDAVRKKVLIVTPTTLLATLKTIYFMWQQEKRQKEFEEILKSIEKLYDKLFVFVEKFKEIESKLNALHQTYESAKTTLYSGKGNAINILTKEIQPYIHSKKKITDILPDNFSNDDN